MMMNLVIPSKEMLAKGSGIFDTAKVFGESGLILVWSNSGLHFFAAIRSLRNAMAEPAGSDRG